jgi:hypothetical protein
MKTTKKEVTLKVTQEEAVMIFDALGNCGIQVERKLEQKGMSWEDASHTEDVQKWFSLSVLKIAKQAGIDMDQHSGHEVI